MNVLIVDDEPLTRVLLRRILARELGCTVSEAKDGLEALSAAQSQPPDLIISDLNMPLMDGIELLEALRQFPPLAAVPVVIMTAARETGPVHRAIELGVLDYLLKPLQNDRVAGRLLGIVHKLKRESADPAGAGGRVVIDDKTPLLVADGSADFRHFVASVLGSTRVVHQAATGVAALQQCVESRPGLVMVGSDLGVLGPELLRRKLRSTADLAAARVIVVVPKPAPDQPPAAAVADATVTRTFVPDDFRQQFDRVVAQMSQTEGVGHAARPQLRLEVAAAAEQVFGMLLNLEVELSFDVRPRPVTEVVVASVTIGSAGAAELTLVLRTDAASARHIAKGLASTEMAEQAGTGEFAAVPAVLNVIAGRLKTALEATGPTVTLGAPVEAVEPSGDLSHGAEGAVQLGVQTPDSSTQFVLQLSTRRTTASSAATPAAPATAPAS
jgi:two-component system chemotaxis response regulator CheY